MDQEENKQNPITHPVSVGEQPPTGHGGTSLSAESESPSEDEYIYYNVMPREKVAGTGVKTSAPAGGPTIISSVNESFFSEHKLLIYVLAAIVIFGTAAYFIVPQYFIAEEEAVPLAAKPIQTDENMQEEIQKKEWLKNSFGSENCEQDIVCGDSADPDQDGYLNAEEYAAKTDPNNPDSDKDGLADGDEVKIFGSNPLQTHTSNNSIYDDADYIKGGYSLQNDELLTDEQIRSLADKMKTAGLHFPTLTTLEPYLLKRYNIEPYTPPLVETGATTAPESAEPEAGEPEALPENINNSPEARQDRDAQRYNTTKNISLALAKYYEDLKAYPQVTDFQAMLSEIRPYNRVAVNSADPINQSPYVYSYLPSSEGRDFSLTYFSETQQQLIKLDAQDAAEFKNTEEARKYDDKRISDIEFIQSALLVYSSANITGDMEYTFPSLAKYKTALVPKYLSSIPRDPQTGKDYEYAVAAGFNAFTLKTALSSPQVGYTGYMCDQEGCKNY